LGAVRTPPGTAVVGRVRGDRGLGAHRGLGASAAEQFGIGRVIDNPFELIADVDVDLIVVLPPTSERVPFIKAAI
jgi:predicted dehydrogenase